MRRAGSLVLTLFGLILVTAFCFGGCSRARDSGGAAPIDKANVMVVAAPDKTAETIAADKAAVEKIAADPGENPANPPSAATATASEPKAEAPPRKHSVVPHLSRKGSTAFELPVARKPCNIRLLPVDPDNRRATDLTPLNGAMIHAFVVRADGWSAQLGVSADIGDQGPTFPFVFATGGSHVAWSLFQPQGQPLSAVPTFFNVEGKQPPAASDDPTDGRLFRSGKAEIALTGPEVVSVCAKTAIASMWSKRGKAIKRDADAAGASVRYVAVDSGNSAVIVATNTVDPPKEKATVLGDAGSHAELTFPKAGRWYVWAFSGEQRKQIAARFHLDVKGQTPPDGCEPR